MLVSLRLCTDYDGQIKTSKLSFKSFFPYMQIFGKDRRQRLFACQQIVTNKCTREVVNSSYNWVLTNVLVHTPWGKSMIYISDLYIRYVDVLIY